MDVFFQRNQFHNLYNQLIKKTIGIIGIRFNSLQVDNNRQIITGNYREIKQESEKKEVLIWLTEKMI